MTDWYFAGLERRGMPVAAAGGGGGDSAAYTNFIARTSGLDATHLAAYKTLLDGLTTDGLFNANGTSSFLDILYILATQDATTARLNLVNNASFNCTLSGTPTFTTDRGYAQNLITDFLNTNYDPVTNATNLVIGSSCSLFGYNRTSRSGDVAVSFGGRTNGSGLTDFWIAPYWSDNQTFFRANDASATVAGAGGSQGWYAANRSAAALTQQYFNPSGSALATGTDSAGTMASGNTLAILGVHQDGSSLILPTTDQVSAMGAGASMNATQHTALWNRVKAFLTTVGAYP